MQAERSNLGNLRFLWLEIVFSPFRYPDPAFHSWLWECGWFLLLLYTLLYFFNFSKIAICFCHYKINKYMHILNKAKIQLLCLHCSHPPPTSFFNSVLLGNCYLWFIMYSRIMSVDLYGERMYIYSMSLHMNSPYLGLYYTYYSDGVFI